MVRRYFWINNDFRMGVTSVGILQGLAFGIQRGETLSRVILTAHAKGPTLAQGSTFDQRLTRGLTVGLRRYLSSGPPQISDCPNVLAPDFTNWVFVDTWLPRTQVTALSTTGQAGELSTVWERPAGPVDSQHQQRNDTGQVCNYWLLANFSDNSTIDQIPAGTPVVSMWVFVRALFLGA